MTKSTPLDSTDLVQVFSEHTFDRVLLDELLRSTSFEVIGNSANLPDALVVRNTSTGFSFAAGELRAVAPLLDVLRDKTIENDDLTLPFLSVPNGEWADFLRERYGTGLRLLDVVTFSLDGERFQTHVDDVAGDCSNVDVSEIEASDLPEVDALDEDFRLLWMASDTPRTRGMGFAAKLNGRVVSVAFNGMASRLLVDVSVTTAEEHRQRGFGRAVCIALIRRALDDGRRVRWGTVPGNVASIRLAHSLRFVREPDHRWARFIVPPG